jgi:hypothetical protein
MKKPRRTRKSILGVPLESQEMRVLAQWLDMAGVLWCHVPNGGKRHIRVAAKLKKEGVKRGCPDILIFTPPPRFPIRNGTAIELKRSDGGVVSREQKEWLENLRSHGWVTTVAYGADDAIRNFEYLGYSIGKRKPINFDEIPLSRRQ